MQPKPMTLVPDGNERREIIASPNLEPVEYSDVARQLGIFVEQVTSKELIDERFVIIRAKQFDSSFKEQEHAYYVVIKRETSTELFGTVLGGAAVVEVLDQLAASNDPRPVRVTLRFKEGGKYNGYYFFE